MVTRAFAGLCRVPLDSSTRNVLCSGGTRPQMLPLGSAPMGFTYGEHIARHKVLDLKPSNAFLVALAILTHKAVPSERAYYTLAFGLLHFDKQSRIDALLLQLLDLFLSQAASVCIASMPVASSIIDSAAAF